MQLEGTVALVTGGARRVGRAIALELARAGCDIGIHYHTSHDEAQQLATEIADMGRRVVTIAADLKDATCWSGVIQQTVDNLNRLDILINNAAVFPGGGSDGVDEFRVDLWESVMRINLIAPMGLSRHAKQHLAARGGGKIINLCDISSDRPWTDHLAYCSSKAALVALTKGLARALEKISGDREVLEVANRATQHMYIINPIKSFEARAKGLFSTHPPTEERIERLRSIGAGMQQ